MIGFHIPLHTMHMCVVYRRFFKLSVSEGVPCELSAFSEISHSQQRRGTDIRHNIFGQLLIIGRRSSRQTVFEERNYKVLWLPTDLQYLLTLPNLNAHARYIVDTGWNQSTAYFVLHQVKSLHPTRHWGAY